MVRSDQNLDRSDQTCDRKGFAKRFFDQKRRQNAHSRRPGDQTNAENEQSNRRRHQTDAPEDQARAGNIKRGLKTSSEGVGEEGATPWEKGSFSENLRAVRDAKILQEPLLSVLSVSLWSSSLLPPSHQNRGGKEGNDPPRRTQRARSLCVLGVSVVRCCFRRLVAAIAALCLCG